MSQNNSLTHLAYRSLLDSVEDILGKNGKNSVLRFAGLEEMITSPPEYDPDKRVAYDAVSKLFFGVRDIVGHVGYETIMSRGGVYMVRMMLEHSEALRNLVSMDFDIIEKLKIAYSAYVKNAGYDPEKILEFLPEQNQIRIHRADCTECEGIIHDEKQNAEFKKPSCAFMTGVMQGIGECFKSEIETSAEEVKCRLTGDDECLFVITYGQ